MRLFLKLFISLLALMMMGCAAQIDETYTPSIAALMPNETLVMDVQECHWGCTGGIIKFKGNMAKFGRHSLELTSEEVSDLDRYILRGRPIVGDPYDSKACVFNAHEIKLTRKKWFTTTALTDRQTFPCDGKDSPALGPFQLVDHFLEFPKETPYWRLSKEDQLKRRIENGKYIIDIEDYIINIKD